MPPLSLLDPQYPEWSMPPRRCPVHKHLLEETQEAGKQQGGRKRGSRERKAGKKRKGEREGEREGRKAETDV